MPHIFVVAAPSGAGKSSLVKGLMELDSNLRLSVSHTTRKPRGQEVDGREFFFIDKATYDDMVDNNEFVEHAEVHGNYYGTSWKEVESKLNAGYDVILELDIVGALNIKNTYDATLIFILPPSMEELKSRLIRRNEDSMDTIEMRLANAYNEIKFIKDDRNAFDYIVVNRLFEDALFDMKCIVKAQRLKSENNTTIQNFSMLSVGIDFLNQYCVEGRHYSKSNVILDFQNARYTFDEIVCSEMKFNNGERLEIMKGIHHINTFRLFIDAGWHIGVDDSVILEHFDRIYSESKWILLSAYARVSCEFYTNMHQMVIPEFRFNLD